MVENVVIFDGEKIWKEIKIMFLFIDFFEILFVNNVMFANNPLYFLYP